MKTETIEEFKARGGRVNYLPVIESPEKDKTLKTKLADKWPTVLVKTKKRNTT